ncbi:hypothetical protein SAMN00017477_1328 [Peptoniphilus asaccharolyticus DSM 20463]|uniref:Lipoprotein n=1 Tax=Peptoniphilus asaccharolyticus DSM 20463 TaxID=573058 RepID=A0A1W1V449_PEPAS|nr:DUF6612 family protein [Peptoniphilus asaccharolyticus]MBL7576275.1 hypothetical protein [Peptoniphilus asaccharolyticus]SMB88066.1 hypothetical protein SAMN00017477_1328 [Peptoniphilus asaccharolyticus DSM 20463]
MKRYLIVPLIVVMLLIGCSQNTKNNSDTTLEATNKKEIFSKLLREKDLMSYVVKTHSEVTFNAQSDEEKEITVSNGIVEVIKEPNLYHAKWEETNENAKNESEEYIIGKERFYRDNKNEWSKQLIEDTKSEGETTFVPKTKIDSSDILDKLEDFYEITESKGTYILKLESNSNNIIEIKNILFGKAEGNSFLGDLKSLKAEFYFEKDTYNPVSFDWEISLLNKENEVTETRKQGTYEKVNQLESIEIPEEIKNL